MKKSLMVIRFIPFLILMFSFYGFDYPAAGHNINSGFAVVELFTSEGCSSCPPAEAAVAALAKDYPANVYVLSFHVDYWNYLGWKDEFSSADFTNRQQQYAGAFNINSIYTPQAVVNGSDEFTGSDKKKLYASVVAALSANNNAAITLSAKASNTGNIAVSYQSAMDSKTVVQLALVQPMVSSAIQRGENKGMLLHHMNVVRGLKTTGNNTGTIELLVPKGLLAKDCRIIAFIQNKSDLRISGASSCSVQ